MFRDPTLSRFRPNPQPGSGSSASLAVAPNTGPIRIGFTTGAMAWEPTIKSRLDGLVSDNQGFRITSRSVLLWVLSTGFVAWLTFIAGRCDRSNQPTEEVTVEVDSGAFRFPTGLKQDLQDALKITPTLPDVEQLAKEVEKLAADLKAHPCKPSIYFDCGDELRLARAAVDRGEGFNYGVEAAVKRQPSIHILDPYAQIGGFYRIKATNTGTRPINKVRFKLAETALFTAVSQGAKYTWQKIPLEVQSHEQFLNIDPLELDEAAFITVWTLSEPNWLDLRSIKAYRDEARIPISIKVPAGPYGRFVDAHLAHFWFALIALSLLPAILTSMPRRKRETDPAKVQPEPAAPQPPA